MFAARLILLLSLPFSYPSACGGVLFSGRPPFAPLARAAEALAGVDAAPPRRAISRIHAWLPKRPTTSDAILKSVSSIPQCRPMPFPNNELKTIDEKDSWRGRIIPVRSGYSVAWRAGARKPLYSPEILRAAVDQRRFAAPHGGHKQRDPGGSPAASIRRYARYPRIEGCGDFRSEKPTATGCLIARVAVVFKA